MDCACGLDWAEARWFAQPLVTAVGIGISVWIAVTIPQRQKRRERLACAVAASHLLEEALKRIADRLEIRFDPPSYARTGRRLRQNRANATIKSLMDLKIEDLPVELVPAFSEARGALSALNDAMNSEPPEPWPPRARDLVRYRTIYEVAVNAVGDSNAAAHALKVRRIDLPAWTIPPLSGDEQESIERAGEERPGA